MKNIYIIGGTMGIGKTSTCQALKKLLPNSVFLDGDWCWDMHPFQVTAETKAMVLDNICHLLNNFLACSAYQNIIFCWVLDQQRVLDNLIARLNTENCNVINISLLCEPSILTSHLQKDVQEGIREKDILAHSLERLPLYQTLDTLKVDIANLSPSQVAQKIATQKC